MKNKRTGGAIIAVVIAAGIGVLAHVLTTAGASADTVPSAPTGTPVAATSPADLTLSAGAAGPVNVGMSKADAVATGLFDVDLDPTVEGCTGQQLAWKETLGSTFDVQTLGNGEVASIGVRAAGPKTASGLGVGSTYAEVLAAVSDGAAIEAGYGQSGVLDFDAETGGWIGYLFNPDLEDLEQSHRVSFIEITQGERPSLMRDGC